MEDSNVGNKLKGKLNLKILKQPSTPFGSDFNYKDEFNKIDLKELKKDIFDLMVDSKDWWPADFGTYAPLFIRMAWHSAGTYRTSDGRGGASTGAQRFEPLNSWPDNVNLDKARRLLWPIKKKYGNKISWADLMIYAGNCALESMGFKTFGFGGGREDIWSSDESTYWGPEKEWLEDKRHDKNGKLENSLAAVQMGLIYVNPEGPNSQPSVLAAAKDIRETFKRMGMNDEETVALIAGGHTFGKAHGAADPSKYLGPDPENAPVEEQGLGWKNSFKSGKGKDTITSGLEGSWTPTPIKWDSSFFDVLFGYDWDLVKSPAGAWQWVPTDPKTKDMVPDAFDKAKKHKPIMFTTDLALRMDPIYGEISKRFHKNPDEFYDAFTKAWFKLTHRDMGPISRYLGDEVPKEQFIWQDPIPEVDYELVDDEDIKKLKVKILKAYLNISDLIYVAWSSASTYRDSDKRGGANGARIALEPQKNWEVNEPERLSKVLNTLQNIKDEFNESNTKGKKISLADMIVLGGVVALEEATRRDGKEVKVPFTPGRNDASQEETDIESFSILEPKHDGFRNYIGKDANETVEASLIDKSQLLKLTPVEMTILIGGLRVLGTNFRGSDLGLLTDKKGVLSNDFFVNLLDMDISWEQSKEDKDIFIGRDRKSGEQKYRASRVDLIFGSNTELRAIAEFYAQDDNKEKFIIDFIKVWDKVINLDRFDLK